MSTYDDYINGAIGLGQLGGSIASLFGGGQDNNQSAVNNAQKSAIEGSTAYRFPIVTPGYTFGGGILANRNTDYLDANRKLAALYGQQLGGINSFMSGPLADLRSAIKPGYGQLTDAMVGAAQSAGQQAYGNLRAQLAQRGISGASFANNQLSQQSSQNLQDENLARAQAFQQEMQSTLGLNQQQMDALAQQLANINAQGNQANQQQQNQLAELGLSTSFLKNVLQYTSDAQNAYKDNQIAAALGLPSNGGTGTGGTTGGTTGGGTGGTASGWQGLPMPGSDDHKWTQMYKQFKAANDLQGYIAYLKSRGAL